MNSLILSIIVAYASNTSGGRINITDEQGSCPQQFKVAFSYAPSGEILGGCWTYSQGLIMVTWDGGEKRIYESSGFTVTPEFTDANGGK